MTTSAGKWRWVDTGPVPGPMAMAIDESLLLSYRKNPAAPIFRVYGWSSPTISLGRFQEYNQDISPEACAAAGIPLVRRITGGGAIYHDHEVTYSLICSRSDLGRMTVKESYRKLCGFLIEVYRGLGLDAQFAVDCSPQDSGLGRKTVYCFAGREAYDILVPAGSGFAKLGGNAQRRLGDLVFQHGSIPLTLRMEQQQGLFAEHALPQLSRITALYPATGLQADALPPAEIHRRIYSSFAEVMDISWIDTPLSAAESAIAVQLCADKYTNPAWNLYARDTKRD